jgi:hypothetical protein
MVVSPDIRRGAAVDVKPSKCVPEDPMEAGNVTGLALESVRLPDPPDLVIDPDIEICPVPLVNVEEPVKERAPVIVIGPLLVVTLLPKLIVAPDAIKEASGTVPTAPVQVTAAVPAAAVRLEEETPFPFTVPEKVILAPVEVLKLRSLFNTTGPANWIAVLVVVIVPPEVTVPVPFWVKAPADEKLLFAVTVNVPEFPIVKVVGPALAVEKAPVRAILPEAAVLTREIPPKAVVVTPPPIVVVPAPLVSLRAPTVMALLIEGLVALSMVIEERGVIVPTGPLKITVLPEVKLKVAVLPAALPSTNLLKVIFPLKVALFIKTGSLYVWSPEIVPVSVAGRKPGFGVRLA